MKQINLIKTQITCEHTQNIFKNLKREDYNWINISLKAYLFSKRYEIIKNFRA